MTIRWSPTTPILRTRSADPASAARRGRGDWPTVRRMSWTIDVPVAASPTLPSLPEPLATTVAEDLARPAAQQPAWPDVEFLARVRGVLEAVPPIAVPTEVDRLQGLHGRVAR